MKKYLFEYILHPDEWTTFEDLIKCYGLGEDRERCKVFGEELIHSKGMIHLYPLRGGESPGKIRFSLERELTKSRVFARLLRAGKIKLLDDEPKPPPGCMHPVITFQPNDGDGQYNCGYCGDLLTRADLMNRTKRTI